MLSDNGFKPLLSMAREGFVREEWDGKRCVGSGRCEVAVEHCCVDNLQGLGAA